MYIFRLELVQRASENTRLSGKMSIRLTLDSPRM